MKRVPQVKVDLKSIKSADLWLFQRAESLFMPWNFRHHSRPLILTNLRNKMENFDPEV